MKKYLLILLVFIGVLPGYSQYTNLNVKKNNQRPYVYRQTEGSGMIVPIDTVTALDTLIYRLNGEWRFVETGKAYWIGYTDNMFSIAAHGDAAIEPLMNFIGASTKPHGRYGAVFALHLIGINNKIAGRFYEEFTSVKARTALRELMQIEELQDPIMELLKRDPWQSDVPCLFAALSQSKADDWPLVNGLTRYKVPRMPMHEPIPSELGTSFKVPAIQHNTSNQLGQIVTGDTYVDYDKQLLKILANLQQHEQNLISIDESLFHTKLWGSWATDLGQHGPWLLIDDFLKKVTEVDYYSNGSHIQYYLSGDHIHICSTITAKQRLLTWWDSQAASTKSSFNQNAAAQ